MKKHWISSLLLWGCFWGMVFSGTHWLAGQEPPKEPSGLRNTVMEILVKGPVSDEERQNVRKFFLEFHLQRWNLEECYIYIPNYREDLQKILKTISDQDGQGYAMLVRMLFDALREYADDPELAQVVRYNAVLTIGELNQTQASGRKPTPLPDARKYLESLVKSSKTELYLKIAALKGLVRHADSQGSDAEKNALANLFDTYAFAPTSKKGHDAPEVIWMRELALQGLGYVGNPGAKGERVGRLLAIIQADKNYSLETRTIAAVALTQMRLTPAHLGKTKPMALADTLFKLAAESLTNEYQRNYTLRKGVLEGYENRQTMRAARMEMQTPLTPEENSIQIRSLRQRTKFVAKTFADAMDPNKTDVAKLLTSNSDKANYSKIYKKLRDIRDMYDKIGVTHPKKGKDKEGESPEPMMVSSSQELQFVKLHDNLEKQLQTLYDLLGLDKKALRPKVKRRPSTMRL
ncbi:MAG: hypothetical protein Q4D62_00885 [Planctomycetia bacterium]|nr:hypothetical protein [Planctomycetia bacterium]